MCLILSEKDKPFDLFPSLSDLNFARKYFLVENLMSFPMVCSYYVIQSAKYLWLIILVVNSHALFT
jgi:hypothetical protein